MITERIVRLRNLFRDNQIDGLLVVQPENRYYLSGFAGSAGSLLVSREDAVLATDFRYAEQALAQATEYRVLRISGAITEWLPQVLKEAGIKRLGFESEHTTFDVHSKLSAILEGTRCRLVPCPGLTESLREIKESGEVELIEKAIEISDRAYEYISHVINAGMTEREAAWEVEKFMRDQGSQPLPFEVIVASGPNSA